MAKRLTETRSLEGAVALVTGASRGVGRGVALGLGEAGATVYLTGRTLRDGQATVPLAGSVSQTARDVDALGGKGIPCKCDHRRDGQVERVFERVKEKHGRLDILVNNAWSGYENLHNDDYDDGGFWERPLSRWDAVMDVGVRSHYVCSWHAAPIMIAQGHGLIVNISFYSSSHDIGNGAYAIAKLAVDKMTIETSRDLEGTGVSCMSVRPGLVRTEGVMRGREEPTLADSESPLFVGRAVACLASDSAIDQKHGQILSVGELAQEYGFKDEDGTTPEPYHLTSSGARFNDAANAMVIEALISSTKP